MTPRLIFRPTPQNSYTFPEELTMMHTTISIIIIIIIIIIIWQHRSFCHLLVFENIVYFGLPLNSFIYYAVYNRKY